MKRLFLLLLSIFTLNLFAEAQVPEQTSQYLWYQWQYGMRQPRLWSDSVMRPPVGDTTFFKPNTGAIMMHTGDNQFYRRVGPAWVGIASGATVAANEGLSFNSGFVQLGQPIGAVGNPAIIDENREIPIANDAFIRIKDNSGSQNIIRPYTISLHDSLNNVFGTYGQHFIDLSMPGNYFRLGINSESPALTLNDSINDYYLSYGNGALAISNPGNSFFTFMNPSEGFSNETATDFGHLNSSEVYIANTDENEGGILRKDFLTVFNTVKNTALRYSLSQFEIEGDSANNDDINPFISVSDVGSGIQTRWETKAGRNEVWLSTSNATSRIFADTALGYKVWIDSKLKLTHVEEGSQSDSVLVINNGDVKRRAVLTGSSILNFPDTPAGTSSDLTITITGASDGDVVSIGVPNAATLSNGCFTAWVSATDTITIRFTNNSSGSLNPASGTFKATVYK